jgi:dUTP pyrophosphatase
MIEKVKDLKEGLEILKKIQLENNGIDLSNPESLMKSMGIDLEDIENSFNNSIDTTLETKVEFKYINLTDDKDPEYAYESDSGFDLRTTEDIWVLPNDRKLVPTGLRFDIPLGYELQVRSKSGLALNKGLMVLNSPGTVDSGYQGEVKVILFNTTNQKIKLEKGQKIAQAVLCPVLCGKWVNLLKVESIEEKDRNNKGFGSTGI